MSAFGHDFDCCRSLSCAEQVPNWRAAELRQRKAYVSTARALGVIVPNAAQVSATVARQWHQGLARDAWLRAYRYAANDTPLSWYWGKQWALHDGLAEATP